MGRFILLALGLLVVAFSLDGIGAHHHCPKGWRYFDYSCYKFFGRQKNWTDAEAFCAQVKNGSHLVSIQNRGESNFVARVVIKNLKFFSKIWIGLNDPEKNGTWKWSNGSNVSYTSWDIRQPNNEGYCVVISWPGYRKWTVVKCDSKRFFICEIQSKRLRKPGKLTTHPTLPTKVSARSSSGS